MVDLDNPKAYEQFDPAKMLVHLHRFAQQCQEAWEKARTFKLPPEFCNIDKIVVLGVGGSAIGGELVRSLTLTSGKPIIFVHRDYDLPAFVDDKTLIIGSSYSGRTEETISAFSQALNTKAKKLVITTGGKLKVLAKEHKIPLFIIDYVSPPRVALGYSLFSLLAIMYQLGFLKEEPRVGETVQILEGLLGKLRESVPNHLNPAKQLAGKLYGKLIVIYGAGFLSEVACRWKTQLNENSKAWAFYETFPELNHNAVVGYEFPEELKPKVFVVLLRSQLLHQRILARYPITAEIMNKAGIQYQIIDGEGRTDLSQLMSLVLFGDWVSYYLAVLYETDPSPVKVIDYLKERLGSISSF